MQSNNEISSWHGHRNMKEKVSSADVPDHIQCTWPSLFPSHAGFLGLIHFLSRKLSPLLVFPEWNDPPLVPASFTAILNYNTLIFYVWNWSYEIVEPIYWFICFCPWPLSLPQACELYESRDIISCSQYSPRYSTMPRAWQAQNTCLWHCCWVEAVSRSVLQIFHSQSLSKIQHLKSTSRFSFT